MRFSESLALAFSLVWPAISFAGSAPDSRPAPDAEQRLARQLEWFRDQKFGLFMHWGGYSQLGCIESWPLVWADRTWANKPIQTMDEMLAFRQKYWALNKTFNPTQFDPQVWAGIAKRAGMKYVMFTTKHHDGFSMFDTRQSEYRVTGPDCPWSRSPKADVTKAIFDAFRADGFGIGAYFSKADWHHPGYWDPDRPALNRNVNYDTTQDPQRWDGFVRFTHAQIEELMSNYGKIDILWLDGNWVRPPRQDLHMDELAAMARRHQPDLILVDRGAGTSNENYRTPEQEVPDKPLSYPWETCMTMGDQWSYKPNDTYKSTRKLINLLVDIVAKGGNFLLNVGPTPEGKLPDEAVKRLDEIGQWMNVNSEAIYGTRPIAPYKSGRVAFTSRGNTVYAIYLAEDDKTAPPATITLPTDGPKPKVGSELHLLGVKEALTWGAGDAGIIVQIPDSAVKTPPCEHAWVLRFEQ